MTTIEQAGLTPDKHNANKGTQRGRGLLEKSLRKLGAGRSILTDKDGNVIAGNKTLEVAAQIDLPVRVIETDGNELVVVKRTDLDLYGDDKRARELAYADNKVAELGLAWDVDAIAADMAAGVDLGEWGFDAPSETSDAEPQIDRAAELNEKWQVKTGDLWRIGEHRLLCGDSTKREDVERVMGGERAGACVTDPPYGLGDTKSFNDDHADYDDEKPFDLSLLDLSIPFVIWGGNYYEPLPIPRNKIGWIVWDKRPNLEGDKRERADRRFGQHFEIAITTIGPLRGKMLRHTWGGYYGDEEIVHKTQKPAPLFRDCIKQTEGVILDYFAGSGTTLVACQNLSRKCRAIEISPNYCAVILERMATAFPGIEIERIN